MSKVEKPRWIECVSCKRKTKHETVHAEDFTDFDEEAEVHYGHSDRLVRCLGCEAISYEHESWDSTNLDERGSAVMAVTLYPSRTARREPAVTEYVLPTKVREVYADTLKAYNAEARLLAAVGLRALVESICIEAGCTGGNLVAKINRLVAQGAIAATQARFLDVHRVLGNDAVHQMDAPPAEELKAALDIIESVMKNLYELPEIEAEVRASHARRQARKKLKAMSTAGAAAAMAAGKVISAPKLLAPAPKGKRTNGAGKATT